MKKITIALGFLAGTLLGAFACHSNETPEASDVCAQCDCGCNEGFPCVCCCSASPDRNLPDPKEKKKDVIPDLATILNGPVGSSNWGVVHLDRTTGEFKLTNHPRWSAEGKATKDGKVSLVWTESSEGKRAPGFYEWDGKQLNGAWGWGTDVEVNDDGTLNGQTSPETIYALPPPPIDL